jgi:hypothetical protein
MVMEKDWTGNSRSAHSTIGARNYAYEDREINDYYATEPKALEMLLEKEHFSDNIWECACGEGHLSRVLEAHGHTVLSTDLIDRGYGTGGVDFLTYQGGFNGDIITNPPYKYALDFVRKALDIIPNGHKVAMFLKLQFLEGKARRDFFENTPPRKVYVSSSRLHCAMNGDFEKYKRMNAVAYAWFIWEKGNHEEPIIKWFN